MACILYNSLGEGMRGIFPHKAGEWCGNVSRRDIAVSADGVATIINQAAWSYLCLPFDDKGVELKIGKPAKEENFSSKELEKYGGIGLYLTKDYSLQGIEDTVEIDTDMFLEDVASGERPVSNPINFDKIRRSGLAAMRKNKKA